MTKQGPRFLIVSPLDPLKLDDAYREEKVTWKRTRLLVVRLAMTGIHTREEVAGIAGCSVAAVGRWARLLRRGGLEALLARQSNGRDQCPLTNQQREAVGQGLREGRWTRIKDLMAWAREDSSVTLSYPAARRLLKRLGAKIKVPRRSHTKKA